MSKENANLASPQPTFLGESSMDEEGGMSLSAPDFSLTASDSGATPAQMQTVQRQEAGETAPVSETPLLTDAKAASAVSWDNDKEFRIDWVRNLQLNLLGNRVSTDGNFDVATVMALAQFQHDQGLGVDGKIGYNSRQRLEQVYPNLLSTVVGDHLDERVLVPAGASDEEKYSYYRSIVENAGGVFLTGAGEMNLLGIRGIEKREDGSIWQSSSAADFAAARAAGGTDDHLQAVSTDDRLALDDLIVSLWVQADDAGATHVEVREREGSVDPSQAYGGTDRPGTAHLRDGQYSYQTGRHSTGSSSHQEAIGSIRNDPGAEENLRVRDRSDGRREYNALRSNRNVEVWRESRASHTNDLHLDAQEEATSNDEIYHRNSNYMDDGFAINIHASRNTEGNSQSCQNIPVNEYLDFMTEVNASSNTSNILYTLIDASKIENGLVLVRQSNE